MNVKRLVISLALAAIVPFIFFLGGVDLNVRHPDTACVLLLTMFAFALSYLVLRKWGQCEEANND